MSAPTTSYTTMPSPLGSLLLAWRDEGLERVSFQDGDDPVTERASWHRSEGDPFGAAAQLAEYFAGQRRHFELPLCPSGTQFQLRVWHALATIPYGQTVSYGALAVQVGQPQASRAVGAANGRNPLPVILPCHRVVGADGRLTGFRGGLHLKEFLLDLERRTVASAVQGIPSAR